MTQLAAKYYRSGNYELGFHLWLAAASEGDAEAMKYVGKMYEIGKGTEANAEKAVAYYQMAAENGCIDGLICLGKHSWYANGELTEENIRTGMEYFLEAAENGSAEGMWNLGLAYLNLEAVKDSELALKWFDRANEAGYERTDSDQDNYQRAKEAQKNQKSTSTNGGFFTPDKRADIKRESEKSATSGNFFASDSEKCYFCSGSGICPYCHGRGRFSVTGYGYSSSTYYDCEQCEGSGQCPHCSGD